MAVLSDKTIKGRLHELIPKGNAGSAVHCCYEFKAAVLHRGGSHKRIEVNAEGVAINPAELVWIKASEEITVPKDMVGLWNQTQTLSRQGLLLLNITLIEPGYEGPLTAVLVNFGNKKVIIRSDTNIAKVIFLTLDKSATDLIGKWDSNQYDANLMDMATNAPETFLQLQSFLPDIEQKANAKLEAIEMEIRRSVDSIVDKTKDKLRDDLRSDLKGTLLKWGGSVALGLFFGIMLIWFMISTLLPRLSEYSKIDTLARKAAVVHQAESITGLKKQLQTQTTTIESIRKELNELKLRRNSFGTMPPPPAGNSVSNK